MCVCAYLHACVCMYMQFFVTVYCSRLHTVLYLNVLCSIDRTQYSQSSNITPHSSVLYPCGYTQYPLPLLQVALDAAKALDEKAIWDRLGRLALQQGNHLVSTPGPLYSPTYCRAISSPHTVGPLYSPTYCRAIVQPHLL